MLKHGFLLNSVRLLASETEDPPERWDSRHVLPTHSFYMGARGLYRKHDTLSPPPQALDEPLKNRKRAEYSENAGELIRWPYRPEDAGPLGKLYLKVLLDFKLLCVVTQRRCHAFQHSFLTLHPLHPCTFCRQGGRVQVPTDEE